MAISLVVAAAALLAAAGTAFAAATPQVLVVDGGGGTGGTGRVLTYPAGGKGISGGPAVITGTATGLSGSSAIARGPSGAIWVANAQANTITAYASTATGNAPPVATLAGSATGLAAPRGIVFDSAGDLYVANAGAGDITEYAPGASGNATPMTTLMPTGFRTRPTPWGLALDAAGNLWVTDPANDVVDEFLQGAARFAPPNRLQGALTQLSQPKGIAVTDAGLIVVADSGSGAVTSYAMTTATYPNVAPVATLSGANTRFSAPSGVAVDGNGNLWVTDASARLLDEFAPGATGNAAPMSSLGGGRFSAPMSVLAVSTPVVMPGGSGVSATSATLQGTLDPHGAPAMVQFAWGPTTAYGHVTSSQRAGAGAGPETVGSTVSLRSGTTYHFQMIATTALGTARGPDQTITTTGGARDPSPATLYAAMGLNAPGSARIVVYAPGASGDMAPQRVIKGPHTGLINPIGLAVDPQGDLFVADDFVGAVFEFPPGASGDASPSAVITIPGTPFRPTAVAADATGHLLVTNVAGNYDSAADVVSVHRFALVNGTWSLEATMSRTLPRALATAVAFGPDGQNLETDQVAGAGEVLNWGFAPDGATRPLSVIAGPNTTLIVPSSVAEDAAGSVFVADQNGGRVLRFAPPAFGNVAPASTLHSQLAPDLSSATLDAADRLIVGDVATRSVDVFAPGATGDASPTISIVGPLTDLSLIAAVAAAPHRLAVVTTTLPPATLNTPYSATLSASGGFGATTWSAPPGSLPPGLTLSPNGTISGTPTTTGTFPITLTVTDQTSPAPAPLTVARTLTVAAPVLPSIYVADGLHGTLSAFPLSATGDTPPTFTLGGSDGLVGPAGVAVDSTGRVYATSSNTGAVQEYPPGAGTGAQPDRTITGSNTGLLFPTAIALDSAGGLYVSNPPANSITYFAPGADGNVAPQRTIAGPQTQINDPEAVVADAQGDLWVANMATNTLTEYGPGASGDAAPIATVTAPAYFNGVDGLALDEAGNLLVTNRYAASVDRIAPNANGITNPLGIIQGASTGLSNPHGIDIDAQGRIVVSNEFGPSSITVYPADAAGDVAPVQTISGPTTGLGDPILLAVTPPLSIQTHRLPRGKVGTRYNLQLRAALGTAPYHWRITHGRLPPGLRLAAGRISGVPRTAGRWRLALQALDASHPQMRSGVTLTLTIGCPRGRSGTRCQRGAVTTRMARLTLAVCRRSGCITYLSTPLRVLSNLSSVTLERGRRVSATARLTRRRGRLTITFRLARPLPSGVYTLHERARGHKSALRLTF